MIHSMQLVTDALQLATDTPDNGILGITLPPPSAPLSLAPATVSVYIQNNVGGSVDVYQNSTLVANVSTSQTVNFNIGDTFTFTAKPSSGYSFQKFCADTSCTVTTTSNPFTGTITVASGSVYTLFNKGCNCEVSDMCLMGTCVPKIVVYGAVAIFAMNMMKEKK